MESLTMVERDYMLPEAYLELAEKKYSTEFGKLQKQDKFKGTLKEYLKWKLYAVPARGDRDVAFVPSSDSDAWPGGYVKASIDAYDSNLDIWTIRLRWMKHERFKHVIEKWDAMEEWYNMILEHDLKTKQLREFVDERQRVRYTTAE